MNVLFKLFKLNAPVMTNKCMCYLIKYICIINKKQMYTLLKINACLV